MVLRTWLHPLRSNQVSLQGLCHPGVTRRTRASYEGRLFWRTFRNRPPDVPSVEHAKRVAITLATNQFAGAGLEPALLVRQGRHPGNQPQERFVPRWLRYERLRANTSHCPPPWVCQARCRRTRRPIPAGCKIQTSRREIPTPDGKHLDVDVIRRERHFAHPASFDDLNQFDGEVHAPLVFPAARREHFGHAKSTNFPVRGRNPAI